MNKSRIMHGHFWTIVAMSSGFGVIIWYLIDNNRFLGTSTALISEVVQYNRIVRDVSRFSTRIIQLGN